MINLVSKNILFSINSSSDDFTAKQSIKLVYLNSPMTLGFGKFPDNNIVNPPFITSHPKNFKGNYYSLVLDLDETLIHFFYTPSGGTFLVRPYAHEFLKQLSSMYEIIIFTAAMKEVSLYIFIYILIF